jgi:hypothetical protein
VEIVREDSSGDGYAKVGWIRYPSATTPDPDRYTLVEFKALANQTPTVQLFPISANTSSYYTVTYYPGPPGPKLPGTVDFYRDGAWLSSALVGYGDSGNRPPTLGQVAAQINTLPDQMPGGQYAPMYVSDAQIYVGGSWTPFSGQGFNSDPNEYGIVGLSTSQFYNWDRRCSY